MLLKALPPANNSPDMRVFVCQPCRSATKTLPNRVCATVCPTLCLAIGLCLSHGVREHNTDKSRTWFRTTGYLVWLVANHPRSLEPVTHLVINEVH